MQIKKYIASTLKEATEMMKDELGDEAIILSTRIKEADPKKGTKKVFELVAGIEDEYDKKNVVVKESFEDEEENEEDNSFHAELQKISRKIYGEKIKNQQGESFKEPETKKVVVKAKAPAKPEKSLKDDLSKVVDLLTQREVHRDIISLVIDQLKSYKSVLNSKNLESYVLSCLSSMIPIKNLELKKRKQPYVISLVGPTGVGKTTCIAKLAVISKILHNLNVGLISIDTYRLGALDQLKIFSEISNIDMLVAYEASEIPNLMNSFKKKDIIFIDTAGRSQNNQNQLLKTKEFFKDIKVDEIFLVLSASNSLRTLKDVAEKFSIFNYKGFIFSKLDEAVAYGNILNLSYSRNMPVSFLSNGQVIPDDIISADSDFIAEMIYSGRFTK